MSYDPALENTFPNILVTGTPGVGKSSFCEILCEEINSTDELIKMIDINEIVKSNKFYEEEDAKRDCFIVDEDKLINYLEKNMNISKGGLLFDSHLCGAFPSNWFDLIIVLRCDNTALYDRLKERNYKQTKIEENIQAEIFQVILDEANQVYGKNKVIQLTNSNINQQETNVEKTKKWIQQYINSKKKS